MKQCCSLLRAEAFVLLGAGSLALVGLFAGVGLAQTADASGGWDAMQLGFASKARVAAGTSVTVQVLTMGNSRGIVVTYSGNPQPVAPGKLWDTEQLAEGKVLRYQVEANLNKQFLAVRSGSRIGINRVFDVPVRAEPRGSGYVLSYDSGRVLLVTVGGTPGDPETPDISGGWVAGRDGFASVNPVPRGTVVTFQVEAEGNALGAVVTYSGNPQPVTPGKLWNRNELRPTMRYKYAIDDKLSNQKLAFRSGANPGGYDVPRQVARDGDSYKLSFASGRVVVVHVSAGR